MPTPFARQEGPDPGPSRKDIRKGLASLGIKLGNDQVEKLMSMGGANVLQSIVKTGGQKRAASSSLAAAPPSAPQAAAAPHIATPHNGKKNLESVSQLLAMPGPESRRQTASGDDARDTDRVVTGLQSDRHRHFQAKEMGRKKVQIRALESLKACGADAVAVFRKIQKNAGSSTAAETITPEALKQGLKELAGVQLSDTDVEAVVTKINGGGGVSAGGGGHISLSSFADALSSVRTGLLPKSSRDARKERFDRINLTNKKSADPAAAALQHRKNIVTEIDAKLSKRFGTEPDRLRRLYMSLERNGDGTVSKANLRKGMAHLGMGITDAQFGELMKGVEEAQTSVNAAVGGDDVYFSDLIHVFEKVPSSEGAPMNSFDMGEETRRREDTARRNHQAAHRGSDLVASVVGTGLPDHFTYVDFAHRKVDPFAETPQPNTQGKRRPRHHSAEERRAIRIKKTLLSKLGEKGKSVSDAFLALDADRDGVVTQRDMKRGLMMGLGIQLAKDELETLVEHTIPSKQEGVTYQEFSSILSQDDAYHAYMNDRLGSGGGGDLEGPVAAAVGADAVKRWTGRREHRGQLSSAMTARGTLSLGPQFANPHAVGVVGGTTSALDWSAQVARDSQPSIEERRGQRIEAEFGEKVRRRTHRVADTFRDMDLNSHGSLSYSELRNGLDRIGVNLSDDDFGILTRRLDKDNDGRVEFEEFAKTVRGDVSHTLKSMAGPQLDDNGNGIRVGMTLTTTRRNYSDNVGEILQMPPAARDPPTSPLAKQSRENSWVQEQSAILAGASGRRSPSDTSLQDLSHVATRLKVRDTLSSKVGGTLREQYLSLERGPGDGSTRAGGAVTVNSLQRTLEGKGAAISTEEVASLLVDTGIAADKESARKSRITFNDFKKLVHLTGLGDDVRSYDFARAVQLPPGVGLPAGGLRVPERHDFSGAESHEVKHLNQPAGGARAHASPEHAPRKRVWHDKNAESGAVAGMISVNSMSVANGRSPLTHDIAAHYERTGKHHNILYRQHDHIRELGLMGESHVTMGHEGMVGETGLQQGHGRSHLHTAAQVNDHWSSDSKTSTPTVRKSSTSTNYDPMSVSPGNSAAPKNRARSSLKQKKKATSSRQTPRHLQSRVSIQHDHIKHDRWGGKKRVVRPSPSAKVLRLAIRPPPSPAAKAASEKKAGAAMFGGAAGVSSERLDNASHGRRTGSERYKTNSLFSNMSYPHNSR
jgi:Ca2+-binding EF-hand superfamily protein